MPHTTGGAYGTRSPPPRGASSPESLIPTRSTSPRPTNFSHMRAGISHHQGSSRLGCRFPTPDYGGPLLTSGGFRLPPHRSYSPLISEEPDYFATSSDEVDRLLATLESRLESGGLSVSRVQVYPGFARLAVSDGYETTRVDLAWDRRLWPPEQKAGGAVLSEEELAADKLLALADRGEARDYIDVAALADRFGFSRLYDLARRKHPKLYPGQLLYSMREFDSLSRGV